MSEQALIAAFLLVAGAIGTLAKLLWNHVLHCRDVRSQLSDIAGDVKHIKREIGDHESGLRGANHRISNKLTALEGKVGELEQRTHRGNR